jgi:hypothetical protein
VYVIALGHGNDVDQTAPSLAAHAQGRPAGARGMIEQSRLRVMRDEGDHDSSIPAAGDHETGTARASIRL